MSKGETVREETERGDGKRVVRCTEKGGNGQKWGRRHTGRARDRYEGQKWGVGKKWCLRGARQRDKKGGRERVREQKLG